MLIRLYDKWFYTDPNFSSYTGAVVKRMVEPGIDLKSIRPVDYILISHNHFDHLDQPSLRLLRGSRHLFVPEGGLTYIPKDVIREVHGVQNFDVYEEGGVRIAAVPVKHFGGRWLVDNLWDGQPYTGYIIQYRGVTVFFAGDTGYSETLFKNLKSEYNIDVALIPVGPAGGFSSGGFGNAIHVNPLGGVQIFKDCGAKFMIPIHHSTFYRRGGREMDQIRQAIAESTRAEDIFLLDIGETVVLKRTRNGKLQRVR